MGELVITASLKDSPSLKSHRILASLKPGVNSDAKSSSGPMSPPAKANPSSTIPGSPYFAVVVGLDSYRERWPGTASTFHGQSGPLSDALEITGLFSGADHTKSLQGAEATKAGLERAIFSWAQQRVSSESVLIFYFYGHALVHASTGEVYLLPYDSAPSGSSKALIPLQALQNALFQLNAKATLLFLDTPLIQDKSSRSRKPANWVGALPRLKQTGNQAFIQISHRNPAKKGDSARMLAGLFGRADHNRDHVINVGELLDDLKGIAVITPPLPLTPSVADIPLTQ